MGIERCALYVRQLDVLKLTELQYVVLTHLVSTPRDARAFAGVQRQRRAAQRARRDLDHVFSFQKIDSQSEAKRSLLLVPDYERSEYADQDDREVREAHLLTHVFPSAPPRGEAAL